MSTYGGGSPAPVSGTAGPSKKRGRPAMSTITPPGTAELFPASTTGELIPGRRSPGGAMKCGSALTLPTPALPPWTSLYVTDAEPEQTPVHSSPTESPQKTLLAIVLLLLTTKAAPYPALAVNVPL